MTDPELEGIARQSLNMMKRDAECGKLNFFIGACAYEGEPLHRMRKIEQQLIDRCGERWLNDERMKSRAFHTMRLIFSLLPPAAIVFGTAANMFRTTKKFDQLPAEEQEQMLDGGHDRHHTAVKRGLMTIEDVLQATAQTPQRVCISQWIRGHTQPEPPHFLDQKDFAGRLKMFGPKVKLSDQMLAQKKGWEVQ